MFEAVAVTTATNFDDPTLFTTSLISLAWTVQYDFGHQLEQT